MHYPISNRCKMLPPPPSGPGNKHGNTHLLDEDNMTLCYLMPCLNQGHRYYTPACTNSLSHQTFSIPSNAYMQQLTNNTNTRSKTPSLIFVILFLVSNRFISHQNATNALFYWDFHRDRGRISIFRLWLSSHDMAQTHYGLRHNHSRLRLLSWRVRAPAVSMLHHWFELVVLNSR